MGSFSVWHLVILFAIVLVIFGPSKLSGLGKAVGDGIRDFKDALRDDKSAGTGDSAAAPKVEER